MKLLEKILVPVTLDKGRNYHLETALTLAREFKSQLLFIHVLPEQARQKEVNHYVSSHVDSELDDILKDMPLNEKSSARFIEYGNTFDRILTTAENENVNLILMPNFLERASRGYSMDLVAEKLVRKSDKPVWIVKEEDSKFPETMLCTIDFSDASRRALYNAIKMARTFRKKLHILNVLKPVENNFSPRYTVDFAAENAKNLKENDANLHNFLEEFDFTDVDYLVKVVKGEPEEQIFDYVINEDVKLLFMGATGKTYLQRVLLGSVTEKMLRSLPSSIVVTKSENILNLKIDSDITEIEKHLSNAKRLEATGYYEEAIDQLKLSLKKNDLHIPSLVGLAGLYDKIGDKETADTYMEMVDSILKRLWDRRIEFEIRKEFGL